MVAKNASGTVPQRQPSRAETVLENGLSEAADAVVDLIAQARAVDPAADEFGHARSRAYTDAVALLKASAKVGHIVAELRGSKFEHNINVRRDVPAVRGGGTFEEVFEEPEWGVRQYKGFDYNPNNRFAENKVNVRGLGKMHVPDDWDEERWKAGLPQKGEMGGTPLAISEGSNGNFESPAAGKPKIRSV
jgi:hypothetical protein